MVSKIIHFMGCIDSILRRKIYYLETILIGWRTNPSDRMMIAFSMLSINEVLLPGTNDNGSLLHLVAYIRDRYDCVTEYNISSVIVESDFEEIETNFNSTSNSFVQMLASGNQNRISQIITSFSQQMNKINNEAIETAFISEYKYSYLLHFLLKQR